MYDVEALIPDLSGQTHQWTSVHQVPQLDTEQEELQEARRQAGMAGRFYVNVRITESVGQLRKVVA